METDNSNICSNCKTPYPQVGFFCGGCLTQIRCKECDSLLNFAYQGCTNCGTPKEKKQDQIQQLQHANTFRLHETSNERIIEASFSNEVGKDLAGILKDAYSVKLTQPVTSLNAAKFEDSNSSENFENVDFIEDNNFEEKPAPKPYTTSVNIPNLLLIAINNLPNSEVEWIVVYSFYASNFGEMTFTRKDIIDKHIESKRKNTTFELNLSKNLTRTIQKGYINPLSDGYFLIEEGVSKANEIVRRSKGSVPKAQQSSLKKPKEKLDEAKEKPKTSNSEMKSLKRLSDINFYPDKKESLEDFFKKFPSTNDYERNLIFVFYLQEILLIDSITTNHIYTSYDALGLRVSESLPQTIRNTRSKSGWIDSENKVTMKGRNKIKFWNKKD